MRNVGQQTLWGQDRNPPPAKHKTEVRAYTREANGNPCASHYRRGMAYHDPRVRATRESLPNMHKLLYTGS